jgi:hypothetical protein
VLVYRQLEDLQEQENVGVCCCFVIEVMLPEVINLIRVEVMSDLVQSRNVCPLDY